MSQLIQPREHGCRMPDGIRLVGDLWTAQAPAGVVVVRTPYDARQHSALARFWVERGLHCLVQDVRGRHRSQGRWEPYQHEGDDGAEVVAALQRAWPELPVVTCGASYAAHAAVEAARGSSRRELVPPAGVIAMVPALGLAETAWDEGGRAQTLHRIGWWHQHGQARSSQQPLDPEVLASRTAQAEIEGPVVAARSWGWSPHTLVQWDRLWAAERLDLAERHAHLVSPLLVITGDDDVFDGDARRLADTWPAARHLVTGPWGHRLAADIGDGSVRNRLRAAGGIGAVVDRWLAGLGLTQGEGVADTELTSTTPTVSRFDPVGGTWREEEGTMTAHDQLLPKASGAVEVDAGENLPVDVLVDPEGGIIRTVREVAHPPGAPTAYRGLTAAVADARQLGEWPADRVSLGTAFGDDAHARIAAIAEGVERYCGNWLPPSLPSDGLRIASRAQLAAEGHAPLGLDELPTFAPWQHARTGFPYTPLTQSTPTLWARCVDTEGVEGWVPSSLVHLNWRQSWLRHLPRTHHLNYAGIATGQGVDDARDRGVLEVVERDALEVWWHLDGPTYGIDPASVPGLLHDLDGSDLDVWLVLMPSEIAPAVAALVYDPARGIYAAGFSAALDPSRAARKAVLEAVHTWVYTQGCTSADGWVFRAVEQGLMARGLYLDFRKDATYLDAAGEQCENVVDLGAHVQVWLDPRVHAHARRFTRPAGGVRPVGDVAAVTMEEVYARLATGGHRVLTCDLTTRDVRRTPLRVVRTVVTGLVPNAPAAFAYLGMTRFAHAARARGWRGEWDGTPEDFSFVPPPHM